MVQARAIGARTGAWLPLLVALGPCLVAPDVAAEPADSGAAASRVLSAELAYTRGLGAESCPDEAELERAIVARLGEDPFGGAAGQRFRVEVVLVEGRLLGHVAAIDAAGAPVGLRELEGTSGCAELVAALALVVSLAINPELLLTDAPAPVDVKPAEPAKDEPAAAVAPPVPAPKRAPEPPHAVDERPEASPDEPRGLLELLPDLKKGVGVAGLASFGTAPAPTLGGALSLWARSGNFSLALEGRADAGANATFGSGAVRTRLAAGSLVPCWHFRWAAGCAVGLLGSLAAESRGLAPPGSDTGLYGAAGVRAAAQARISSRIALEARTELLGTFIPVTLVRNGSDRAWQASAASLNAGVGVSAEIP